MMRDNGRRPVSCLQVLASNRWRSGTEHRRERLRAEGGDGDQNTGLTTQGVETKGMLLKETMSKSACGKKVSLKARPQDEAKVW